MDTKRIQEITPLLMEIYRAESGGQVIGATIDILTKMKTSVPCFDCPLINDSVKTIEVNFPGIQNLISNQLTILNLIH